MQPNTTEYENNDHESTTFLHKSYLIVTLSEIPSKFLDQYTELQAR